jgi:hypothetical protein
MSSKYISVDFERSFPAQGFELYIKIGPIHPRQLEDQTWWASTGVLVENSATILKNQQPRRLTGFLFI